MDITGLIKQREMIVKKKDDIEYERKQYLEEYSDLKDMVTKTGIVSLSCLALEILFAIFLNSKSATLYGIAKLLSPFVLAIFIAALVIFLSKGFNLFINADTEWSKKLAIKLERTRFTEVLEEINSNIIRLNIEIDKMNNELELAGVDVDSLDIKSEILSKDDYEVEMLEVEKSEDKKLEVEKPEVKKTVVKKAIFEQKKSDNVDDLLSALDSFDLFDDDDEFENSSELWEKDNKILK